MKTSTATILLLLSLGLFFTFTKSEYSKVEALRTQSAEYKAILNNISAIGDKRDELLVKYQNIPKTQVEQLTKALPDNVDIVRLSMDFDTIASKYGISIKSVKVTQERTENVTTIIQSASTNPYGEALISFSFIATYDNFKNFLHDIEESLRLTDVKSVSFQSTENGFYQYQITIQTYWLK